MDFEDMMPVGECVVCGKQLDFEEAGFCNYCGKPFCWAKCGDWYHGDHCCNNCKEYIGDSYDKIS